MSLRTVAAAAAALPLLLVAACGDDDDESSTAAEGGGGDELSIEVTEPDDGAEVGESFDVAFDTSVPLGEPDSGRHHVHLYYDGETAEGEYDLAYEDSFTVTGLSPGEHTVEAVVANADHSLTDARQEVTVTVGDAGGGSGGGGEPDTTDGTTEDTPEPAGSDGY